MMSWLGDLVHNAVHGAESAAEAVGRDIEAAAHSAGTDLLNALFPRMVHNYYAEVRAANWALIEVPVQGLRFSVAAMKRDDTVLAGLVAKKVTQGLDHLKADTDYARAVNSIKW